MHNYSIDTKEHIYVNFYLALLSVVIVYIAKDLLKQVTFLPISISISSTSLTLFGVLYALFDKYCWKWKILRFTFKVKTPILSGAWEGEYKSSYGLNDDGTGEPTEGNIKITIEQTWSKISIKSDSVNSSKSCSQVAGVFVKHNKGIVLKYEYENDPEESFVKSMNKHSGFECLVFDEANEEMNGSYYTDKYRRTYGSKKYKRLK
ncbi:hypothetical protein [uncultured Clostridium sp.]|uniref:Cap15 family cyclic dinucleotide receptor domain-containing protein n=1 Tax=uncultured Clostridium sp. TaxID=59620 RepID=UPI0032165C5D